MSSRQVGVPGVPGQGPPSMVRVSLGSGRADSRISSKFFFSFLGGLLISQKFMHFREATSNDVSSPSSGERMGDQRLQCK